MPDSIETFIHAKGKEDLVPFAVVPHIGEVEPVLILVAHPSEASLEFLRGSVRVRTCPSGVEIEITAFGYPAGRWEMVDRAAWDTLRS